MYHDQNAMLLNAYNVLSYCSNCHSANSMAHNCEHMAKQVNLSQGLET